MTVRDELQALVDRDGFITAESVLSAAANPTSSLHTRFEWDDTEAARRFRVVQAGLLIRSVKITVATSAEETRRVRAFVSIPRAEGPSEYVPTMEALADERRDVVLQQAIREVAALRRKYSALIDIDAVLHSSAQQDAVAS